MYNTSWAMKDSRSRRLRTGQGDRPSRGGVGGDRASVSAAGGSEVLGKVLKPAKGSKHGHLRYSTQAEADAAKRELERQLRLKRLEQVRQQSRQHAAAIREDYRQRREENKRTAVLESMREYEATKTAEVLALNQQLQNKLVEVGSAHRMATSKTIAREQEEERLRALRSASIERTRERNRLAGEKQAGKMRETRKSLDIAAQRQQVWRDEGGTERARAREEAEKQAAVESTRRAQREASGLQFQQQVGQAGRIARSVGRVAQVGPRLEDFKTSRVHAAFVLQHGSVPGTRLMGVETATGDPAEELRRKEAAEMERQRAGQAAESRAEKRGHEAFAIERDRRQAEGLEQELRRLHELDRLHRQGRGAAGTNLAVMRQNELRRAKTGYLERRARTPEPRRVKRAKPFDGGRRQAVAVAEAAGAETPSMIRTEKVDQSAWEAWPAWWPTAPPPHLRRTGVATSQAAGTGIGNAENLARGPSAASSAWASDARRPKPRISERERLSMVEQTRRELFDAAERAQKRGRGLLSPETTPKRDGMNVGEDPEPRTSRRLIRGASVPVATDGRRAPTTTDVPAEMEAKASAPVPVSPPLLGQRVRPTDTERRSEAVASVRDQAGEESGTARGEALFVEVPRGVERRAGGGDGVASGRTDLGRASPTVEGRRTEEEPFPPAPQGNRGRDAGHEAPAPAEAHGDEVRIQDDEIGPHNTGEGPISSTPLTSTSPQPQPPVMETPVLSPDAAGDGRTPPSASSPTPETSREPVRSMTVSPSSVKPPLGSDLDTQSGADQSKPGSSETESDSRESEPPRLCSTSLRKRARRQGQASSPEALGGALSDATVAESANGRGIPIAEDVALESSAIKPEDEGARVVGAAGGARRAGTSQEPREASIPVAVDFNELAKALLAGGESTSDRRDAAVQVTPGESSGEEGSLPRDGDLADASPGERRGTKGSDGAHLVASDQAPSTARASELNSPTESTREAGHRSREDASTQPSEAAIRHPGHGLETSRRSMPRKPVLAAASATLDRATEPNDALTSMSESARRRDSSPSDRSLTGSFRRAGRQRTLDRVPSVTSSLRSSTGDPAPVASRGNQSLEHPASGIGGSHMPSGSVAVSFGQQNSPISASGGDPPQLPVEPDPAMSDPAISPPLQSPHRRGDEDNVETRQLLNMFDGVLDRAKTESGFPGATDRETARTQGEERIDSAVSSSTSTLPPLDDDLVELLERHRRLDEEARELARQAEVDAARWDLEGSSSSRVRDYTRTSFPVGLPTSRDDPSSFPKSTGVREHVESTLGSSADTFRRSEETQRRSTVTDKGNPRSATDDPEEGIQQSRSYGCPGEDLHGMPPETPRATFDCAADARASSASATTPRSVSSTATGGDIRGGLFSRRLDAVDEVSRKLAGNAGGDISSPLPEEELARSLGMRDLSVQGSSDRWRSEVRGSRSASGSSENASLESGGKVHGSGPEVSSGRNVNMNQEVTEWARRIQASIESMNRLVDGFRSSSSGTTFHARGATGAVSGASLSPTGGRDPAARGTTVHTLDGDTGIRKTSSVKAEEPPAVAAGVESFAAAQLGFRRRLEGLLTGRSRAENDAPLQTSPKTSTAHEELSRSLSAHEIRRGSPAPDPNAAENSDIELGSRFGGQVVGSDRTVSTDALEALGERLLDGSDMSWSEIPKRTRPASSATSQRLKNRRDYRDHDEHRSTSTMSVISTITSVDPAGKVSSLADDILNSSLASFGDIRSAVGEETKGEGLNMVTSPKPRRGWDGLMDIPDSGVFSRVDRGKRTAGLRGGDVSVSSMSSSSFGPDLEAEIESLEVLAASLQQRTAARPGPKLQPRPEQDQQPGEPRRPIHTDFVAGPSSITSEVGKDRSVAGAKETRASDAPSPPWRTEWDRSYLGGVSPLLRDENKWKAFPFRDAEKASSASVENMDSHSDDAKSVGTRDPRKISNNLSPASSTFHGVAAYTDRSEDQKRSPEPYDDFLEELRSLREAVAKLAPPSAGRPPPPPPVEIGGPPRRARLDHPSGSAMEGTVGFDDARGERDFDGFTPATPVGHAEDKASARHPWSSKTLREVKSLTGDSDVDGEESKGEGGGSRQPGVNPNRTVVGPVEQEGVQTVYRTTPSASPTDRTRLHAVDPRHGEARESSGQASHQASASDFLPSPLGAGIGGDISSLRLSSRSISRGWDVQHRGPNLGHQGAISPTGASGGAANISGQWENRGTAVSSSAGNALPSPSAVCSSHQTYEDEVAGDQIRAPFDDDTSRGSKSSDHSIVSCDKETGEADRLGVVDQRGKAKGGPADDVGHVMTEEGTYGSRLRSPDVEVGGYADMGREVNESGMIPDPVGRGRCFSGGDEGAEVPPSGKISTEGNVEDVRAEFERSFTSEGVSLDPELLAAAVARRQAASELSPLEAPGWGSLADFIERNSASAQSPVSRRDLRQSGGESHSQGEEDHDEKVGMTCEDDGLEATVGEVPSGDERVLAGPAGGLYSGRRGAGLQVKSFSGLRGSPLVEDETDEDQAGEEGGSSQSRSPPNPSPRARGSVGGSSTSGSPQNHDSPGEAPSHEGRDSGEESNRRDQTSNDAEILPGRRSRRESLMMEDKPHSGEDDEEPSVKNETETDEVGTLDKNSRGKRRPGGRNISAESRSSSGSSRRARRTVRASNKQSEDSRSLSSDDSIGDADSLRDGERQRRLEGTPGDGEDENRDLLKDTSEPKSALTTSGDRRPEDDLGSDGYLENSRVGELEAKEDLRGAAHSSTDTCNQVEGIIGEGDVAQEKSQLEESSTDLAGDEEDVDITGQLRSLLDLRERLQRLAMDTDSSGDFSRMDQEVLRSASASAAEDDEKSSEKEHRRFDQTATDDSGLSITEREQKPTAPTQESIKVMGEHRWWLEGTSELESRGDESIPHEHVMPKSDRMGASQRDRVPNTTSPEDGLRELDERIPGEAITLTSDESQGPHRVRTYDDSARLQGNEAVEDETAASERGRAEDKGSFAELHSSSLRIPGESMADGRPARHELSGDSHASGYPSGVAGDGRGEDGLHRNSMSDDDGLVSESKAQPKSADSFEGLQTTSTKGGWLRNVDRSDAGDVGRERARAEESGGDGSVAGQIWLMADLRDRLKHMTSDSERSDALLEAESRSEKCPSDEKERQTDESRADGGDTVEEGSAAALSWSMLALRDRLQHITQDSETSDRLSEEIRSSDGNAGRAEERDEQAKVSEGETKSDHDDSAQSWSLLRLRDRLKRVTEDTESSFDMSQTNRSDEGHRVLAPGRDRSGEEPRPDATTGETERVLAPELNSRSQSNDSDGLQENDAEPEDAAVDEHTRSNEENEVQDEGRPSRSQLDLFSRTRSSGQHSPGRRQHLHRSASGGNPLFEGASEQKFGELVEELFPEVDDADWWLGDTHELDEDAEDAERETGRSGGRATEASDLSIQPRPSTVTSSNGGQIIEDNEAKDDLARRDSLGNFAADSCADSGTEGPLGRVQHGSGGNGTESPPSRNRADPHSNLEPASPRPGSAEGAEFAEHSSDALGRAEQIDLSGGGGSALGLACSDGSSWMDQDGPRDRGLGEEGHESDEDRSAGVEDRDEHERHPAVDSNVATSGWAQDVVDLVATMSLEDDCSGDYSRESSVRFGRSILSDDSRLSERRTNLSDGAGSRPTSRTEDDSKPSPGENPTVSETRASVQEDGSLPASAPASPPGNPPTERLEIPTEYLLQQASDRSTDSQELSAAVGNRPSDGERFLPRNVAVSWSLSHAVSEQSTAEDRHRRSSTDERHELGEDRGAGELASVFNSRASAFIARSKARETAIRQRRESRRKAREESSVPDHPNADDVDAEAQSFAAGDDAPVEALPLTSSSNLSSGRDGEKASANTPGTVSVGNVGVMTRPSPPALFAEERPRRRVSTKEARERTARLYNNLPEVREAKERREQEEERVRRLVTSRNLERERTRFGRQRQRGVGRGGEGLGSGTPRK